MTPSNPLLAQQPDATDPSKKSNALTAMMGLPGAAAGGAQMTALAQMLGPGSGLGGYLRMAGPEYADQIDQMEWNPQAVWF